MQPTWLESAERAAADLGDVDGLDLHRTAGAARREAHQPFPRAVFRDLLGDDLRPLQREGAGERRAHVLGDVEHVGEIGDAAGIDPVPDLARCACGPASARHRCGRVRRRCRRATGRPATASRSAPCGGQRWGPRLRARAATDAVAEIRLLAGRSVAWAAGGHDGSLCAAHSTVACRKSCIAKSVAGDRWFGARDVFSLFRQPTISLRSSSLSGLAFREAREEESQGSRRVAIPRAVLFSVTSRWKRAATQNRRSVVTNATVDCTDRASRQCQAVSTSASALRQGSLPLG